MKFIVTAGGQGTKLWPYSREDKPKQFHPIRGNRSLLQYQVDVLLKSYAAKDIFISTKEQYIDLVREQLPQITEKNIILEPNHKKNRGPGEGLAVMKLAEVAPNDPFMIIQSDCIREPEDKYLMTIEAAERLVRRDRKLITGGQRPSFPDMGSDYLRLGRKDEEIGNVEVYKVEKFVPRLGDFHKTKELIEEFSVSTHCNHCCWYPELMLDAYEKHRPDWHESLVKMRKYFGKANEQEKINEIYSRMEAGATEDVTQHIFSEGYVILLPFRWTDIGTWGSVHQFFASNDNGTHFDGDVVAVDTKDCLVKAKSGKLVAVIGVENIVIVDTDDVLLVCKADRTGDIKEVLGQLYANNKTEYL